MKLEIWVDDSLEIMHIFFFSSYVENSSCYGNKLTDFQDFWFEFLLFSYAQRILGILCYTPWRPSSVSNLVSGA
jgi:hypothetical protein